MKNKETKTNWARPQLTQPQVKELAHHIQRGTPQVSSNNDTHANHTSEATTKGTRRRTIGNC
jgi:hypothetical protein